MAIIKKKIPNLEIILIPSKDGLSLSDNTWNSGRSLALYEANLLIKYAKENNINVTVIGNGSKLLVKDKGIRGIWFSYRRMYASIK